MESRRVCIKSSTIRSISFYDRWVTFHELVIEDAPSLERLVPHPYCGRATIHIIRAPKLDIIGLLLKDISTLYIGITVFHVSCKPNCSFSIFICSVLFSYHTCPFLEETVSLSLTTKMHAMKVLVLDSIGPNLDSVINFLKVLPLLAKAMYLCEYSYLPLLAYLCSSEIVFCC